ncbi:polysaccharide deacetylase family protein [Roseivirga thermotolerans]|uniref:polysaccharide deacetylase family protein n=1 Tax=Roseivirga thermotolerans TaxID=1758176 RepID=UPI00273E3676|nr:polysaccharide deacetylase family protein [Roseivirga thermotolerans]
MRSLIIFLLVIGTQLSAQEGGISAFVYHRFGDDRFPSTNVSLDKFEAHLKFLKDGGYEVLTFSEAIDRLKRPKKGQKAVVLTIDDGYSSFYEKGLPLLQKYGFKATLFVNTETVGGKDYMNWSELKKVQEAGIEIGNHSHSHAYFLNKTDAFFEEDLQTSEDAFIEHLGTKPTIYAYPYGEWNAFMANTLKKRGYKGAAAQNSGVMHSQQSQFYLPRFPMSEFYANLNEFKQKANMHALLVSRQEVNTNGFSGSKSLPRIELEFTENKLKLEQLQCFVQGAECRKSIQVVKEGLVKLSIRPDRDLKRRRTLFTITVPDSEGRWHWFSYLWVIPQIAE